MTEQQLAALTEEERRWMAEPMAGDPDGCACCDYWTPRLADARIELAAAREDVKRGVTEYARMHTEWAKAQERLAALTPPDGARVAIYPNYGGWERVPGGGDFVHLVDDDHLSACRLDRPTVSAGHPREGNCLACDIIATWLDERAPQPAPARTDTLDAQIKAAQAMPGIATVEAVYGPHRGRTDTQRLEFVLRELCVAAAHNLRHTWAPKDRAEVDAAMDADASEEGSDGGSS